MEKKKTFTATKFLELTETSYYTYKKYINEGLFEEKDKYTLGDVKAYKEIQEQAKYTLKDLSEKSGISKETIRKYLNQGLFTPSIETKTEKRTSKYYNEDKIVEIQSIYKDEKEKQRQAYIERSYYVSPEEKAIGGRLKIIREALGFTVEYVEEQTGINYNTIYAYEQGRANPNPKVMELYTNYGANPDWIWSKAGTRFLKRQ